ncbi:hypothetical protein [Yersinia mollaretii]|uniref:hypothetical protein n=1 Tax=Yersinia mollaretii TaxID=33060 RepID=UPI0005E96A53|nr:hypothetical protein [Yersinia mollaretii]CNF50520.1 Uncharacterised protein [Yersinia mollaretii]
MSKETLDTAHAILELKQPVGIFKDYLFPISMSLFSALVGGSVALIINAKQDIRRLEREKFYNANRLIFNVFEGLGNLVTIKSNYYELNSDNPYLRVFEFPEILINCHPINIDLSNYAFIRDTQTCNFTLSEKLLRYFFNRLLRRPFKTPSKEELGKTWRNLSRIGAMLSNYNTILHHIEKRNKLDDVAREKLLTYLESHPPKSEEALTAAFQACLGKKQSLNLIDLTELTISLIDHVILEMDSFIKDFPNIAESNIELSKVEMKKRLMRVHNDRPMYIQCLKPLLKPNFAELAVTFGQSLKTIEHRYTLSQWY